MSSYPTGSEKDEFARLLSTGDPALWKCLRKQAGSEKGRNEFNHSLINEALERSESKNGSSPSVVISKTTWLNFFSRALLPSPSTSQDSRSSSSSSHNHGQEGHHFGIDKVEVLRWAIYWENLPALEALLDWMISPPSSASSSSSSSSSTTATTTVTTASAAAAAVANDDDPSNAARMKAFTEMMNRTLPGWTETPLTYACLNSSDPMILDCLVKKGRARVDIMDGEGHSPMSKAVISGDKASLVQSLLDDHEADPNQRLGVDVEWTRINL